MSIALAEQLKKEWTDKYVVVDEGTPELKRFSGLTGTVRTINMNGRALVEFDGPVDIGWYDIAPEYLTVVDAPVPKKPAHVDHAPAADVKPAGAKAAPAKKPAGKSPLELARQQGAAKAAGEQPAEAKPAGKKLSPLELARMQGAAKQGGAAAPAAAEPAQPAEASKPPAGKNLSPLEMARMQGAAKRAGTETAAPAESASATATETAVVDEPPPASAPENGAQSASAPAAAPPAPTAPDGRPLSKIELARRQGAFKGKP